MQVKIRETERHHESPFIHEAVIKIDPKKRSVVIGNSEQLVVDTQTGEIKGIGMMHQFREVDREQFVKIYVKELDALFNLTKAGLRVLGYILKSMRINKDILYLHTKEVAKECGYKSQNQVVRGLIELTQNSVIAKSDQPNLWWINPNIIFNGDRIAFIKEYKIKQPKTINLQTGEKKELQ